MKKLLLLPLAATAAAIAANAPGFILGGPREGWELAVSVGYLLAWAAYLLKGRGWKLATAWWVLTALCAGAGFVVMAFDLDGFLLIFPALALLCPPVRTGIPDRTGLCGLLRRPDGAGRGDGSLGRKQAT